MAKRKDKKTLPKARNPHAKALANPLFRPRVVPNAKREPPSYDED